MKRSIYRDICHGNGYSQVRQNVNHATKIACRFFVLKIYRFPKKEERREKRKKMVGMLERFGVRFFVVSFYTSLLFKFCSFAHFTSVYACKPNFHSPILQICPYPVCVCVHMHKSTSYVCNVQSIGRSALSQQFPRANFPLCLMHLGNNHKIHLIHKL